MEEILEKLCRKRIDCFVCGLFVLKEVNSERKTRVSQWKKSIVKSKGFQRENIFDIFFFYKFSWIFFLLFVSHSIRSEQFIYTILFDIANT